MKDKIVKILQNYALWSITGINVNNYADQILTLFDINKIEVFIGICGCGSAFSSLKMFSCKCKGTGFITRPATWDDIEKGGILRYKE